MNGEPILFDQDMKDEYVELVCRHTNLMYREPFNSETLSVAPHRLLPGILTTYVPSKGSSKL
jgi:hypothetical protein